MAVLTAIQLRRMRNHMEKTIAGVVNYKTPKVNVMLQAFEDERVARETTLFSDVDSATSPKTFTTPRKRKAYEAYMLIVGKDGF